MVLPSAALQRRHGGAAGLSFSIFAKPPAGGFFHEV
jgi:hypothetical protein